MQEWALKQAKMGEKMLESDKKRFLQRIRPVIEKLLRKVQEKANFW